eukprot:sb/3465324/
MSLNRGPTLLGDRSHTICLVYNIHEERSAEGNIVLRWKKVLVRVNRPLWPNLTKTTKVKRDLDELSRRYLVAIIRSQMTLRETYNTAPLLAPAHELSRRIKILNAYSREAMLHDHVLQHTMWDITDELIQAHTGVYKKSIFSDCSVHGSRESAKVLYKMLPTLALRLKQRDEDLILMSRKRRRILLKMYTLSIFLSKHCDRVRRELAAARENRGYETDSDFGDDNDSGVHMRQENIPTEAAGGVDSLILMDDSLILDDDVMMNDSSDVIPGLNITSPPSGEQSTVITSSPDDGLLKDRSGVSNMSYTSFEHDISNLLDDSIFNGSVLALLRSLSIRRFGGPVRELTDVEHVKGVKKKKQLKKRDTRVTFGQARLSQDPIQTHAKQRDNTGARRMFVVMKVQ